MTRDIDVIIPQKDKALIADLVETVAKEQGLPSGHHAWLNDGVSFFGLKTRSNKKIFDHPNLIVFTASWHELLGMKLSGAWRRDADFNDAVHILRQIEIAVLVNGKYHTWLIKPDVSWTYWCEKAEALHGIPKSLLFEEGLPVSIVAEELSEIIGSTDSMIYSDADRWDEDWLSTLFYASGRNPTINICSIFDLLSNEQKSKFHSIKEKLSLSGKYRLHRALDDVRIIENAFVQSAAI